MGAEGALDLQAVDLLRSGPALRRAQHDHRPGRPGGARIGLDRDDVVDHPVEGGRELLVHLRGLLARDHVRGVAVAAQQRVQLVGGDAGQHRRVGDLVAVEVQDRQHHAVPPGVEELVRVPARRQRAGLGLAVADHAQRQQVRVVEHRAVGVHQRVAELAALVDRARGLRGDVAGDAAGEGELPEQGAHPVDVLADPGVHLGVGALEVGVGDEAGPAVARPGHVEDVQVALPDHPVHVRVDQVQPRGGPPVPEQARLDVLGSQRLAQQRVVEQVDLADGEVVRRAPVGVDQREIRIRRHGRLLGVVRHGDPPRT